MILLMAARRNVICVANLVQSPLSRWKGNSEKLSRTELLPLRRSAIELYEGRYAHLDWSPTTASFSILGISNESCTALISYLRKGDEIRYSEPPQPIDDI